ncbi:MAG: Rieske (2Fe-2S) protein [Terriglobales bacterium]
MFIRVASVSELPGLNEAKEFTAGAKVICIANVNGTFSAMDNVCLHRGGQLGQGVVLDGKVICPWHGWRWDPVTGAAVEDANLKLEIYSLKIEGDDVLVYV